MCDSPTCPSCGHLQGRIRTFHFRPTTSELVAMLRHLAETIDHPYTDLEERREICEFIIAEAENSQQQIDLRLLKHGLSDFEQYWRGEAAIHWKELIVSSMQDYYAPAPTPSRQERKSQEQDHILELIEETSEAGGSKEAVVEDWMKANEKKKTAFYDRLKELPEDSQKRFRAYPEKRSAAPGHATCKGKTLTAPLRVTLTLCESFGRWSRLPWVPCKSWTSPPRRTKVGRAARHLGVGLMVRDASPCRTSCSFARSLAPLFCPSPSARRPRGARTSFR